MQGSHTGKQYSLYQKTINPVLPDKKAHIIP